MKNKGMANETFIGIACLLLFIFMAFMCYITHKDVLADNATDLYDLIDNNKELKEQYVELYIDGVIGNYAETQHKINGFIPAGTEQHYLIWLEDGTFISVTAKNKDLLSQLDAISNDTWNYIEEKTDTLDKSIIVKGMLSPMNTEIQGYCNEWLDSLGISHSDMRYVTINTGVTLSFVLGELGICLLFIAFSVFLIISPLKKYH